MAAARKRKSQAPSKSSSLSEKDDDLNDDDVPLESDLFYKKWAGPVLLGPFLVALFAAFIIVAGQLVLNTSTGTCGYDLESVVSANIGTSYLFLLVFTWVYLGDTVRITIPIINFDRVVLRPFRSIRWIMFCYGIIGFIQFIIGIYGAFILSLAEFCSATSPDLYQFSLFVVTLFWVGFFVVGMYAVKLFYGTRISKIIKDNVRTETMDEVESRLVRSKFLEFDKTREEKITREDLTKVLQSLGVFVPEEEQEHLADTLDPDRSGFITLKAFSEWFKVVNGTGGSDKGDDDNSEKDEDAKLFK